MTIQYELTPNYASVLYDETTQDELNLGLTDTHMAEQGDIVSISLSMRMSSQDRYLTTEGISQLLVKRGGTFEWMKFRDYADTFPAKISNASRLMAFVADDLCIRNSSQLAAGKLLATDDYDFYIEALMMKSVLLVIHDDTAAVIEGWTDDGKFVVDETPNFVQAVLKEHQSSHDIVAKSKQIAAEVKVISDWMELTEDETDETVEFKINFAA